jgi:hypothetical protein
MKQTLKTQIGVASLGLLLAGFTGCGLENPVVPSANLEPTVATNQIDMPVVEDPTAIGQGTQVPDPITPADRGRKFVKKPKKNQP